MKGSLMELDALEESKDAGTAGPACNGVQWATASLAFTATSGF